MTTPAERPLPTGALRRLTSDPGPWLSCDDCFRLVDRYVEQVLADAEPPDPELATMPAHLAGCPACDEEATTLLLLAAEEAGIAPEQAMERLARP